MIDGRRPGGRRPGGRPSGGSGRARPGVVAAVAAGGMVGASARYGLSRWIPVDRGRFPWATLSANLSGSFLLGLLVVMLLCWPSAGRHVRPFLATGVIGAFTTMSTYAVETALLVDGGHGRTALLYVVTSVGGGLALAYAGMVVGRGASRARRGPAA